MRPEERALEALSLHHKLRTGSDDENEVDEKCIAYLLEDLLHFVYDQTPLSEQECIRWMYRRVDDAAKDFLTEF